jgi:antitoxin ParD1/3/4
MANVEKLSISLPSDLVDYIKDSVGSGSYSTASEFLRETLRERRRREIEERYRARLVPRDAAHLKQMIQEGLESLDNGRSYPAKEVFEKLIAKYKGMAKAQRKARKPKR